MKTLTIVTLLTFCLTLGLNAQINLDKVVKNSKKKAENKIENRIENKIDNAVDNTLDDIEGGVKNDSKDKKNDKADKNEKDSDSKESDMVGGDGKNKEEDKSNNAQNTSNQEPQNDPSVLVWNKYDFVPGSEIIFEDNLQGEQNGEFPSKWDLKAGVVEIANFNGENVIWFLETGNFPNGIVPLLKNNTEDYLPEEFTIEFDAYFEANKYNRYFSVSFYDSKNQKNNKMHRVIIDINSVEYGESEKIYPGAERSNTDKAPKWRHIAISFNKRALKVYMDDTRMINIPNIVENPTGINIGTYNHSEGNFYIKNIRIAKGAVPLYDKVLTDGKFVTSGIKFDINKATIKPESMGTINYVFKMMNENPDLKFSVEGHTDSDGDDASNLKLSEARAKAVMDKLIEMGIDKSRLTSKGFGESKPMSENSTPEGKAQNRRVEFVKF